MLIGEPPLNARDERLESIVVGPDLLGASMGVELAHAIRGPSAVGWVRVAAVFATAVLADVVAVLRDHPAFVDTDSAGSTHLTAAQ